MASHPTIGPELGSSATQTPNDSCEHQLLFGDDSSYRPRTASTIRPGFEGLAHKSKVELRPPKMDIHVALIEQELRIHRTQLNEAAHANSQLTQLQRVEAERVFALVQELNQCERRTAKAEIAVEYLSERIVQIAASVKQQQEPAKELIDLEAQLQRADHDAQTRISVLETEIQSLTQHNEKIKSKLENAMDTIIALISLRDPVTKTRSTTGSSQENQAATGMSQHADLIDLMDGCLTPVKDYVSEEQNATLLNDSCELPDDYEPSPKAGAIQSSSESFDSDISNSSYIVRFKGICDKDKQIPIVEKVPRSSVSEKANSLRSTHMPKSCAPLMAGLRNERPNTELASVSVSTPSEPVSASTSYSGEFTRTNPENVITANTISSKLPDHNMNAITGAKGTVDVRQSQPQWKIAPDFFEDHIHREETITRYKKDSNDKGETSLPDIFRYGIRYLPFPNERNVYRTVIVSNLPSSHSLGQLLHRVRGGMIQNSMLLDTTSITGGSTALLYFLYEHEGADFVEHADKHPIVFDGLEARVSIITTPTWPMKASLHRAIFDHQHTRCLEIRDFPGEVMPDKLYRELEIDPNVKTHGIVYRHMQKNNVLVLHFSSIEHAGHAYGKFMTSKSLKRYKISFTPDPCAQPWETLDQTTIDTAAPIPIISSKTPIVCPFSAHPVEGLKQSFSESALKRFEAFHTQYDNNDPFTTDRSGRLSKEPCGENKNTNDKADVTLSPSGLVRGIIAARDDFAFNYKAALIAEYNGLGSLKRMSI